MGTQQQQQYVVFPFVYILYTYKPTAYQCADEHMLCQVVFDLAGPQTLGTKQLQMQLGVCSILYMHVQIRLCLPSATLHPDTIYSSSRHTWCRFPGLLDFCLACEAEARHMYCFSGVVVVVVGGGGGDGGVNFFVFGSFSRKL